MQVYCGIRRPLHLVWISLFCPCVYPQLIQFQSYMRQRTLYLLEMVSWTYDFIYNWVSVPGIFKIFITSGRQGSQLPKVLKNYNFMCLCSNYVTVFMSESVFRWQIFVPAQKLFLFDWKALAKTSLTIRRVRRPSTPSLRRTTSWYCWKATSQPMHRLECSTITN